MGRNDEGEFELVLGNKQLLSVFFILVVLLGIFFIMGYVVGRGNPRPDAVTAAIASGAMPNTANSTIVDPSTTQRVGDPTGDARKVVEDNLARAGGAVPADTAKPADTSKPSPLDDAASKQAAEEAKRAEKEAALQAERLRREEEAKAKQDAKAKLAEEKKAAELAKLEEKKRLAEEAKRLAEEKKKKPTSAPTTTPVPASSPGDAPPSGVYWQVAAIDKAGAKILADSLRRRSLSAYAPKVENKDLYRVIVGPLRDKAEIVAMRDRLEQLGFKEPMQKKY